MEGREAREAHRLTREVRVRAGVRPPALALTLSLNPTPTPTLTLTLTPTLTLTLTLTWLMS